MRLHDLHPPEGAKRPTKRLGRGEGSGVGKTSGRGHKGQHARSGGKVRPGFEGGQMPLQRRLPKRGFKNYFKVTFAVVNLKDLSVFETGSVIDPMGLAAAGLIKKPTDRVKLLGEGSVDKSLTIKLHGISVSAREAVLASGGTVEILEK